MDILDELSLSTRLKFRTIDPYSAFEAPNEYREKAANLRDEQEYFSKNKSSGQNRFPIEIQQIKIKQTEEKPVFNYYDYNEEKTLKLFDSFFSEYPLVSLNNFRSAEKLFLTYFRGNHKIHEKVKKLQDLFAQTFHENDRFGKLVCEFKLKATHLQIVMQRTRLKDVKQYLAINFTESEPSLVVYTNWNWRHKKEEIIKSRKKLISVTNPKISLEFDAKVWQAFNSGGIVRKNFMKTLECLERNQNSLSELINEVNRKTFINVLEPSLIGNVSIKTDNHSITLLSFRSNNSQKIEAKMTDFASSLVVEH